MLSLIRQMKLDEIVATQKWESEHKATCPHGGKFAYDHELVSGKFGGIKVSVVCRCGARKELGVA